MKTAYLLDTNHCIYLMNGLDKRQALRTQAEINVVEMARNIQAYIFVSGATIGELYFGAAHSKRSAYNFRRIELFKQAVTPIRVDDAIWKEFGLTKAMLKKQGNPITDLDLLIACTSKVWNMILVTNDANFNNLPKDFKMENWASGN